MAQIKYYKTVDSNGITSCGDIGITTSMWRSLIQEKKAKPYLDALLAFYREPNHQATCTRAAQQYGETPNYYLGKVNNFAMWVQKKINRFCIVDNEGKNNYWCIPMQNGWKTKQGFVWHLREELSSALEDYLMEELLGAFRDFRPKDGYDEHYKWELLDATHDKDALFIAKSICGKNIIDNARTDSVLKYLASTKPDEFSTVLNNLFDETKSLNDRIANFKLEMRSICPEDFHICANDERTAAALLTCKYPEKYTFYKDEVYQLLCQYFGFVAQKAGFKYNHFIQIINKFTADYGISAQEALADEISYFTVNPINLSIQTMFWFLKEYMKKKIKKGMAFTWIPYYKEFADKLIDFRNDRKSLLQIIYEHRDDLMANYLHDEKGEDDLCDDIDPFTTFGIFNRTIKPINRVNAITLFKTLFKIKAAIPSDFRGIPVLNNQMSYFFGFRSHRSANDIENLWALYEKVIGKENFEKEFNTVIKQFVININITMALFWIRPDVFLALDKNNRKYLAEKYNIELPSKVPQYKEYMAILDDIKRKMESNEILEKSFCEISDNATRWESAQDESTNWYDRLVETWKRRQNMVLFGAPGTGKTYDIPELAVRLCDPDLADEDCTRDDIMKRYNELKQEKRVAFTTFHQSMDYEDWIEGLRPIVSENNQVTYEVESGIFKQLCEEAEKPIVADKNIGIANDAVVWKVSLFGTGDNPVRKNCMSQGIIRIGWDKYGPTISEETDWSIYNAEGKQILDAFINKMKVGDIVMSCYTNQTIDAIGVVVGDYEYRDDLSSYKRVRKVNWLVKGINENIVEINDGKTMTLSTIYRLNSITLDKVKKILEKYQKKQTLEENTQPYIMVIDEMNRGNVSKIFGELITLLEADKRKGAKNAESVILPYSKTLFQIPKNVFIIATMNSADRSLGTLDYAIRRRFAFIPQKPCSLEGEVEGFDEELFKKVSELFVSNYDEYKDSSWLQSLRLKPADTLAEEFKPEDVWIGQSYFIMNDEDGNDCTQDRLLYEIIPLLEEYIRDGVLTSDAQSTVDELYDIANNQ